MSETSRESTIKTGKAHKSASTKHDISPSENGEMSRRDHIIQLAAQLFAEKGIGATRVRDIGDAAGILSGSLYYHFDSKETIVKEIVSGYLKRLLESYEETLGDESEPRARLEGLIRASFAAIESERYACEIFQNDSKTLQSLSNFPEFHEMTAAVQKVWMDTILHGVETGTFRGDIPPRVFYRFARDTVWFTVRWYNPDGPDTPEALSAACIAVLLDGYATNPT